MTHPTIPRPIAPVIHRSLLVDEARLAADVYLRDGDWDVATDFLLIPHASSLGRVDVAALTVRLMHLDSRGHLAYVAAAPAHDRTHLMWIAACLHNDLVAEFATTILCHAHDTGTPVTLPQVDALVDARRDDFLPGFHLLRTSFVRDNLLYLAGDAGLLATDGIVPTTTISPGLRTHLAATDPVALTYLPGATQ